jgi:hypothetical protein
LAQPAAALRPEEPDAAAVRLAAQDAAGAPQAARAAAEEPQQEAARAEGLRPEAVQDAAAVLPLEVRDAVAVPDVQQVAPGAAAGLPLAAAVFFRAPPPAPSPAARFARAMGRLRMASPKARSSQVARDEVWS